MALNARDFTLPGQWANGAETTIPPIPISGQTYRNAALIKSLIELGQQYDNVADSAIWNQILYLVSGIAGDAETYGWPRWSPLTNYIGGASFCIGTNGTPYRAIQDSGPGTGGGQQDPTSTTGYWQTLAEYIAEALGGGGGGALGRRLPIGSVFYHAASTPPDHSLVCNGAAISRSLYADLFVVIGATYGSGNGSTTFNLPDLRAEFIRGVDMGRGIDAGRAFGSNQKGTLIGFNAGQPGIGNDGVWSGSSIDPAKTLQQHQSTIGADDYGTSSYAEVELAGIPSNVSENLPGTPNGGGVSGITRPRNVALLPCIQFE
jgi:hypothetical protein